MVFFSFLVFNVFIHRLYHLCDDTVCKQIFVKLEILYFQGKRHPFSAYALMLRQSDINLISFSLKYSLLSLCSLSKYCPYICVRIYWKKNGCRSNKTHLHQVFYFICHFKRLDRFKQQRKRIFCCFSLSLKHERICRSFRSTFPFSFRKSFALRFFPWLSLHILLWFLYCV